MADKEKEVKKVDGYNIAAMVLGIVSLVTWCLLFVSVPSAIVALVFGIKGIKKQGKGFAIAGIATAAITIITWALLLSFLFLGGFVNTIDCYNCEPVNYYDDCICDYTYDCYYDDYKGVYNIYTDQYDFPSYR